MAYPPKVFADYARQTAGWRALYYGSALLIYLLTGAGRPAGPFHFLGLSAVPDRNAGELRRLISKVENLAFLPLVAHRVVSLHRTSSTAVGGKADMSGTWLD